MSYQDQSSNLDCEECRNRLAGERDVYRSHVCADNFAALGAHRKLMNLNLIVTKARICGPGHFRERTIGLFTVWAFHLTSTYTVGCAYAADSCHDSISEQRP